MGINKLIGSCGLACVLCSAMLNGECKGCMDHKASNCEIKKCCIDKEINGCFECEDFPCDKDSFKHKRVCAFVKYAKEMGVDELVSNLKRNDELGIKYHKADGTPSDYDVLESESEIINMIKRGKK